MNNKGKTMIVGFGHRARSGKDTCADYLAKNYGFAQLSFGGPLKKAAKAIFGLSDEQLTTSKNVVDSYWGETPRYILQKLGTECLRHGYSSDVWVRALHRVIVKNRKAYEATKNLDDDCTKVHLIPNWVISDVRFKNEAEAIKSWGGILVKLTRFVDEDLEGIEGHPSEEELATYNEWDYTIDNNGTLDLLYARIDALMNELSIQKITGGRR